MEDRTEPVDAHRRTATLTYDGPGGDAEAASEVRGLGRGDGLGRYVVLDRIGGGGMGVVYAAYDPELDRKLAIKLLRSKASGSSGEGQLRLLREAQALARLSHPNVVAVHDVGTFDDQVFVAMEFVEGTDLRRWQRAGSKPCREVLDVYLQAGRGLAAAHQAGLVHRDFKPSNVILGSDGRVRVLDFGLARPLGEPPEELTEEIASVSPQSPVSGSASYLLGDLTEPGVQLGTPAYMAPEQRLHLGADARSDQFGFATALYEALYGELPFAADDPDSFAERVRRGQVRPAPADGDVPPWLRRVLLRALAADPEARYPSMHELLAELGSDPAAIRRRWWQRATVAALVALALWGFLSREDPRDRLCRGAGDRLAGIWDEGRKAEVERVFLATGVGFAASTWRELESLLDVHAQSWTAMRTEACEATHLRGEQSEELLDLRMGCLDQRLDELDTLVTFFAAADPEVVHHAAEMTSALSRLETCADGELLMGVAPPPIDPAARARVEEVRRQLAEARIQSSRARFDPAFELAEQAVVSARQVGYAPLVADALFQLADLDYRTGRYQEAEAGLYEALSRAEEGHHDERRLAIALEMVWVVGIRQARYEEGERWLEVARGLLQRTGEPADQLHEWAHAAAMLRLATGRLDAAAEAAETAVEGSRSRRPPNPEALGKYLSTLGHVQLKRGRLEEALASLEEALEVRRRYMGDEHVLVGATHQGIGTVLLRLGHHEQALDHLRRALEICVPTYGPESAEVALVHTSLGEAHFRRDDLERALEHHHRAHEIRRAIHGGDHVDVAKSLDYLGLTLMELGRLDGAGEHLERALEIKSRLLGDDHPLLVNTLLNLGRLRRKQGREAASRADYERARTLAEDAYGADDFRVAKALLGLGESFLQEGRPQRALAPLERALALFEAREVSPELLAYARFALARALEPEAGSRRRALELALAARGDLERLGGPGRGRLVRDVEALVARLRLEGES